MDCLELQQINSVFTRLSIGNSDLFPPFPLSTFNSHKFHQPRFDCHQNVPLPEGHLMFFFSRPHVHLFNIKTGPSVLTPYKITPALRGTLRERTENQNQNLRQQLLQHIDAPFWFYQMETSVCVTCISDWREIGW